MIEDMTTFDSFRADLAELAKELDSITYDEVRILTSFQTGSNSTVTKKVRSQSFFGLNKVYEFFQNVKIQGKARVNYGQLQKTFELDLSALPQHEQKLANRELHDLHKKIEKQKPKKSFARDTMISYAPRDFTLFSNCVFIPDLQH